MNIGIIGSGGREHALCLKLKESDLVNKIYCFPGNAGTELLAENIDINIDDFNEIKKKSLEKNISIALMIDQRVTEGIKSTFFKKEAFTTTIPAQLVKKFGCPVVSIYIERIDGHNFRMIIEKPIYFSKDKSTEDITQYLNYLLEKMILRNPEQWILTHNRWKI